MQDRAVVSRVKRYIPMRIVKGQPLGFYDAVARRLAGERAAA